MTPRASCADEALVEALHDGRLGPREVASIERHLASCASCRAHRAFLEGVSSTMRAAPGPIAPLAHQRARLSLLRGAAGPVPAVRSRRWVMSGSLAFAAVLAASASWAVLSGGEDAAHLGEPVPSTSSSAPAPLGSSGEVEPTATTSPARDAPSAEPPAVASGPERRAIAPMAPPPSAGPRARSPAPLARSSTAAGPASVPSGAAPPSSAPVTKHDGEASRAFAEAVETVGRGDYDTAAERLARFSEAHPGDARVDESDYLIAIAFERAGRHEEAAAAAQRYLSRHPRGAHRREAETLVRRTPR